MPDNYDIIVKPKMLNYASVSLKGCVSMRYIQTITLPNTSNRQMQNFLWTYDITEKTPNSTLVAVITKAGNYIVYGGSLPSYRVNTISSISISESVVSVSVFSNAWDGEGLPNSGTIDIYEVLGVSTQTSGEYGLTVTDGVNWTLFSNTSNICALAYKITTTVTASGWTVPAQFQSKKFIIFADWSSESAVVQYDSSNYTISRTNTDVTLDIYVFAINPSLTVPTYGITMYNSSGQLTFSSENAPICYPDNSMHLTGEFQNLPFISSLVQITDCGYSVSTTTSNVWIYNVGVVKFNGKIKAATGKLASHFNVKIGNHAYGYPDLNLLVLNKANYAG